MQQSTPRVYTPEHVLRSITAANTAKVAVDIIHPTSADELAQAFTTLERNKLMPSRADRKHTVLAIRIRPGQLGTQYQQSFM